MKLILTRCDFRKQIFLFRSELGTIETVPTYHIIKNGGTVARFSRTRPVIFALLQAQFPGLHDIRDIFKKSKTGTFVLNSTFEYSLTASRQLERPLICVSKSGVFGYDVTVTTRTGIKCDKKYALEFHDALQGFLTDGEEPFTALARVVLLVWIWHPIPFYSQEIVHMFFHAALLTKRGAKTARRIKRNVFIDQIVNPDLAELRKVLQAQEIIPATVRPESIEFWKDLPSIAAMIRLLNAQ
jgi:hypothetical protein